MLSVPGHALSLESLSIAQAWSSYSTLYVSLHLFRSHDKVEKKKLKVQKTAGCQTIFLPIPELHVG